MRILLRPTAFLDSPFGHDAKVARLAGGMNWFAAVELLTVEGNKRSSSELVPVEGIESRFDDVMAAQWQALTSVRAPLQLGERTVRLDQPQVMGIVNITPDSFSDGGQFADASAAAEAGADMAAEGAAIIDVGGESTRPGAKPVWEGDEIERAIPVVRQLAAGGAAVSIDTRKADVMTAALEAGARLVNDVSALTRQMSDLVSQTKDSTMAQVKSQVRSAKAQVDSAITGAQESGREAVDAFRDVADTFGDAIDDSLKRRPYATLAMVAGLGFLFGAAWRR